MYFKYDYLGLIDAIKLCLDMVRIWFGILSQSDIGTTFIDGIGAQVNLIHNLTLASEDSKNEIKINNYYNTFIKNKKYWSKEYKRIAKYLSNKVDLLSLSYREIMKFKWFSMNVKTPKEKQFLKSLIEAYNKPTSGYDIDNDDWNDIKYANLANSNFLKQLLNINDETYAELKKKPYFARSYVEAGLTTLRTVFANTRITVNNRNHLDAIKELKNFDMLLAMNKKVHLNQQVTFYFQYNNHTQYGDNETYNNWIDVRNTLNYNITSEFDKIDFKKLEHSVKLIEATFANHRK